MSASVGMSRAISALLTSSSKPTPKNILDIEKRWVSVPNNKQSIYWIIQYKHLTMQNIYNLRENMWIGKHEIVLGDIEQ